MTEQEPAERPSYLGPYRKWNPLKRNLVSVLQSS